METTTEVDGMHCKSCAAGIETYLKSQEGVSDAEVSYENEKISIEYNKDADLDKIWNQIQEMGYEVKT